MPWIPAGHLEGTPRAYKLLRAVAGRRAKHIFASYLQVSPPNIMLRIGARIVANSPFRKKGGDALRGTQLLLTKTGRDELFAAYKEAFAGGADAVCS